MILSFTSNFFGSLTLTSIADKKTGKIKKIDWAAVTQTLKVIQFVVIWMNRRWPQQESLNFLLELKKISWSIIKSIFFLKKQNCFRVTLSSERISHFKFFFQVPVIWGRECLMKNDIFRVMLLPAICGYFKQRKNWSFTWMKIVISKNNWASNFEKPWSISLDRDGSRNLKRVNSVHEWRRL